MSRIEARCDDRRFHKESSAVFRQLDGKLLKLLKHVQAIEAGHLKIEEHHVRIDALHHLDYLTTVPHFAGDFHIRFQGKKIAYAIPHDGVIICNH